MPQASPPSRQHLCLAFPPRKRDVRVYTAAPRDITILDIHTLSSLFTKRNEGNNHIYLYKHLILIVLLNIKINNLTQQLADRLPMWWRWWIIQSTNKN